MNSVGSAADIALPKDAGQKTAFEEMPPLKSTLGAPNVSFARNVVASHQDGEANEQSDHQNAFEQLLAQGQEATFGEADALDLTEASEIVDVKLTPAEPLAAVVPAAETVSSGAKRGLDLITPETGPLLLSADDTPPVQFRDDAVGAGQGALLGSTDSNSEKRTEKFAVVDTASRPKLETLSVQNSKALGFVMPEQDVLEHTNSAQASTSARLAPSPAKTFSTATAEAALSSAMHNAHSLKADSSTPPQMPTPEPIGTSLRHEASVDKIRDKVAGAVPAAPTTELEVTPSEEQSHEARLVAPLVAPHSKFASSDKASGSKVRAEETILADAKAPLVKLADADATDNAKPEPALSQFARYLGQGPLGQPDLASAAPDMTGAKDPNHSLPSPELQPEQQPERFVLKLAFEGEEVSTTNSESAPAPAVPAKPELGQMERGAPSQAQNQPLAQLQTQVLRTAIALNMRDAQWGQKLVAHIEKMHSEGVARYDFSLRPKNLGDMSVSLEFRGDDTQVRIVTETTAASRVLIGAEDRLAQMLDAAGFRLSSMSASMSGFHHPPSGQGQPQNGKQKHSSSVSSDRSSQRGGETAAASASRGGDHAGTVNLIA